jgi:hypothetical protein
MSQSDHEASHSLPWFKLRPSQRNSRLAFTPSIVTGSHLRGRAPERRHNYCRTPEMSEMHMHLLLLLTMALGALVLIPVGYGS